MTSDQEYREPPRTLADRAYGMATPMLALCAAALFVVLACGVGAWLSGERLLGTASLLSVGALALALALHHSATRTARKALSELVGALEETLRSDAALSPLRLRTLGASEVADVVRLVEHLVHQARSDRQRLRDVAARAFRAQEAERLRIAQELQEQVAQELAVSLIRLRAARAATDPLQRDEILDAVREDLAKATNEIRQYARVLHPPALKDIGLVPAIRGYANSLSASGRLRVQIEARPIDGILGPERELALYRIVQEALGNVVRHARATRATVAIELQNGHVVVDITDDGRGFDRESVERSTPCLGLFAMQTRALALDGEVEITSTPGSGTHVRVRISTFARVRERGGALPLVLAPIAVGASGAEPLTPAAGSNTPTPPGAEVAMSEPSCSSLFDQYGEPHPDAVT
jgi:signal transduction histidine kinase